MFYPKGHQCVNCQKAVKICKPVQFGRFHRLLNLPEDPIYAEPVGTVWSQVTTYKPINLL